MTYSCPHCDGTSQEIPLAPGIYAGACSACGGRGYLHEPATPTLRPRTEREVLWYLTDQQFTEHTAANESARREAQADLDRQYRIAS